MATKKRVYAATQAEEASQVEPGDEGARGSANGENDEIGALQKDVKKIRKALEALKTQVEAHDFAMHEIEDGKKVSALKKSLGMQKFLYAWVKNAEEKNPDLKMEKRS